MIHRAKTVNPFWSKIIRKKLQSFLNPFAKGRRDLNFWRFGVIFQGEFDGDAQKIPAFPKRGSHTPNFASNAKNLWKKLIQKNFWCRKMKRRESSETRFGKVWARSEPSSGGKRLFEIFAFERRTSRLNAERRVLNVERPFKVSQQKVSVVQAVIKT